MLSSRNSVVWNWRYMTLSAVSRQSDQISNGFVLGEGKELCHHFRVTTLQKVIILKFIKCSWQ